MTTWKDDVYEERGLFHSDTAVLVRLLYELQSKINVLRNQSPEVFCKKDLQLYLKETLTQVSSCEFCENASFEEHLRTAGCI